MNIVIDTVSTKGMILLKNCEFFFKWNIENNLERPSDQVLSLPGCGTHSVFLVLYITTGRIGLLTSAPNKKKKKIYAIKHSELYKKQISQKRLSKCTIKYTYTLTHLNSHKAETNSGLKPDLKKKFGRGIRKGENKYSGHAES